MLLSFLLITRPNKNKKINYKERLIKHIIQTDDQGLKNISVYQKIAKEYIPYMNRQDISKIYQELFLHKKNPTKYKQINQILQEFLEPKSSSSSEGKIKVLLYGQYDENIFMPIEYMIDEVERFDNAFIQNYRTRNDEFNIGFNLAVNEKNFDKCKIYLYDDFQRFKSEIQNLGQRRQNKTKQIENIIKNEILMILLDINDHYYVDTFVKDFSDISFDQNLNFNNDIINFWFRQKFIPPRPTINQINEEQENDSSEEYSHDDEYTSSDDESDTESYNESYKKFEKKYKQYQAY